MIPFWIIIPHPCYHLLSALFYRYVPHKILLHGNSFFLFDTSGMVSEFLFFSFILHSSRIFTIFVSKFIQCILAYSSPSISNLIFITNFFRFISYRRHCGAGLRKLNVIVVHEFPVSFWVSVILGFSIVIYNVLVQFKSIPPRQWSHLSYCWAGRPDSRRKKISPRRTRLFLFPSALRCPVLLSTFLRFLQ